ncbi:hypothetical protein HYW17_00090 [Candidatus Uhrbacteria bacterium]|nr:hypothetical protein [Candidatus Uhrbacteria bacterium]
MQLKEFIKQLQKIGEKHGEDAEVIMADNIPVVAPVFSSDYPNKKNVVITDEK